ncbi:unnamed protein product [Pieris brassicae]|uniref:PiggyBac transposable element-derived protein domain-containing protein n=1 Tax=Pieris brassicae TaxID=7116 RepID=A0A9P0XFE8_PIEBR|nr:unnamed protein product [Pieris brassicae]
MKQPEQKNDRLYKINDLMKLIIVNFRVQRVQVFGLDMSGSIVVQLAEELLDEGWCLATDDYYTSIALAEFLLSLGTNLCRNRRCFPKDVVDAKLTPGEIP